MKAREQTFLDRCIAHTDQALRTVFGEPIGSGRDNPASPAENRELSSTDKAKSIGMMRVNHAGEVCAQALYQGQALTAHRKETRDQMKQAIINCIDSAPSDASMNSVDIPACSTRSGTPAHLPSGPFRELSVTSGASAFWRKLKTRLLNTLKVTCKNCRPTTADPGLSSNR